MRRKYTRQNVENARRVGRDMYVFFVDVSGEKKID